MYATPKENDESMLRMPTYILGNRGNDISTACIGPEVLATRASDAF
jgi:hypothetical protein